MKFVQLLVLGILIFAAFATRRAVTRSADARARSFAIRTSAFVWVTGVLAVLGFWLLPLHLRLAAAVPAGLFVFSAAKAWKNVRAQLARERQERVEFERMKRAG